MISYSCGNWLLPSIAARIWVPMMKWDAMMETRVEALAPALPRERKANSPQFNFLHSKMLKGFWLHISCISLSFKKKKEMKKKKKKDPCGHVSWLGDTAHSAAERESGTLFLSRPEGWGSCVKSQQLQWLCGCAAPVPNTNQTNPLSLVHNTAEANNTWKQRLKRQCHWSEASQDSAKYAGFNPSAKVESK